MGPTLPDASRCRLLDLKRTWTDGRNSSKHVGRLAFLDAPLAIGKIMKTTRRDVILAGLTGLAAASIPLPAFALDRKSVV